MDAKIIQFAVRDNNNIFRLELSKALIHLIEFDFTYFWEQCIEAGRAAKKNGRLPQSNVTGAKNTISGLHPYVEADIGGAFSDIVTDCIIEYICHSERINEEELWVRCISPKSLYEEAIFRRISEYKTGKAINQWTNIVKLQEYARNKISFIYDCDDELVPQDPEVMRVRKEYFDLACAVAANEFGVRGESLPSVRVASAALMPNAPFMNAKVAKAIYRRFADGLSLGSDLSVPEGMDCSHIGDRLAMDSYDYVRGMKRPGEIDMKFAMEALKDNAPTVYLPDSFKAIIDLEFDLMMENNIVLRKCESCGRYFTADGDSFFCGRINSSGSTCREQFETMRAAIAKAAEAAEADERPEAVPEPQPAPATAYAPAYSSGGYDVIRPDPPSAPHRPSTIPPVLEKRGQKIYNALYKRVGKGVEEKEFREWSRYLSDMKRNIKIGEAAPENLEEFLNYSDKFCDEVKIAGKNRNLPKAQFNYPEAKKKRNAPEQLIFADSDPEMAHIHVPVATEDERTYVITGGRADVKPFSPETFDSLADAFMAGNEESGSGDYEEVISEISGKKAAVKPPIWKRMTREEAYGNILPSADGEDEEDDGE